MKNTHTVNIGGVLIGGDNPVAVQSMTKTDTRDISATVDQINSLDACGCDIVRVAVKDVNAARALREIKKQVKIPVVADIHFDHRLAVESIASGADKIRINPGNIRKEEHIGKIIQAASAEGVPVRIGINSGSLPGGPSAGTPSPELMVEHMTRYIDIFHRMDFRDIVLSVKASDVITTVKAYEILSRKTEHPLHVGVTAAGTARNGIVRSSIGIGHLLLSGIGDTIRVSLTGEPLEEVRTAKSILSALRLRNYGPEVISCPTCGRCRVELPPLVERIQYSLEEALSSVDTGKRPPVMVAVMGCEVNGPGEASEADVGIAFGSGKGAVFHKGKIISTVRTEDACKVLVDLVKKEYEVT